MQIKTLACLGAAILALGACATPTPYQPATGRSWNAAGYTDQRLEENRFRVTFAGNSMTSRETVELYLLYRAAQLTVEQGYDWFVMADRDTRADSRTYVDRPFSTGPYGFWGPSWRYYGRGYGWRSWDPFWGDPFWDSRIDVRTVTRYEAMAEIVVGRGRKPADNVRAFDARSVLNNLAPRIRRPE